MIFFGSKDIKKRVEAVLHEKRTFLASGPQVLDLPCGNGYSLKILKELCEDCTGADLFPELVMSDHTEIVAATLGEPLPFADQSFDLILCQEGIEHVGNQNQVFDEFSRILKPNGLLLMTTPNYSNLRSRLSYLLTESEMYSKLMPPNVHDSVWLSEAADDRIYFGHVFLSGIQRLLLFARLSGFELKRHYKTRVNHSSLLLFILLYPLILLFSLKTYWQFVKKGGPRSIGRETLSWMINPRVLIEGHLFLEWQKMKTHSEVHRELKSDRLHNLTT